MRIAARSEAIIGSLIAAGGMVLAVHVITKNFTSWSEVTLPNGGPTEIVALGVVIWLHGKWRSLTRVRD
jgi:hypothetical protein